MQLRRALFVLLTLICSQGALAGPRSCLPEFTALQSVVMVDPTNFSPFVFWLNTERGTDRIQTKVQLVGQLSLDKPGAFDLIVRFDPAFDGVSLPFNLYSVYVVNDGEPLAWMDFTNSCLGPGISFFPGKEIRLPAVKFVGEKTHKLQIMVWGRI